MTGFALLGAMIVNGRGARADLSLGSNAVGQTQGINLSGTFDPGIGDPPYYYNFTLDLNPGFSIQSGNSFTIEGLPGVTEDSLQLTSEPGGSGVWKPSIMEEEDEQDDDLFDIKWTLQSGHSYDNSGGSSPIVIGPFVVESSQSLSSPPAVSVNYSFAVTGGQGSSGSGSLTLTAAIPEPSSSTIVLLTSGSAALSGLVVRARRRRSARPA
jgi:hypothetical protein